MTCVEVAEMPSTWLITAIGSPGMLALGTIGNVGSQAPSHLRAPPDGAAAPGVPVSHRSPDAPGPVDPCRAAASRLAASSLACAWFRSAASRIMSSRCSSNFCLELVSAATAASWLDLASAAALSAFCLASRAADSLFSCSVRACCSLAITVCELAVRFLAAASVAMMSSGLLAVR